MYFYVKRLFSDYFHSKIADCVEFHIENLQSAIFDFYDFFNLKIV